MIQLEGTECLHLSCNLLKCGNIQDGITVKLPETVSIFRRIHIFFPEKYAGKSEEIFFLTIEKVGKGGCEMLKTAAAQWFSAIKNGWKFLQKKC